jgi:predicted TIM-barrel fold metal-dependent hydrolase
MGRNGPWIGGKLTERPSAIFQRHVRVAPYPEDDIPWIVDQLGTVDSIVMGSDWPHAEGIAEPKDYEKLLDPLDDNTKLRIMRGTAEQLFAAP